MVKNIYNGIYSISYIVAIMPDLLGSGSKVRWSSQSSNILEAFLQNI